MVTYHESHETYEIRVGSDSRHATVQIPPLWADENPVFKTQEVSVPGHFEDVHVRLIYNGVEHVLGVSVIPVTPAAQRITENQCPVVSVADFHETLTLAAPHEIHVQ